MHADVRVDPSPLGAKIEKKSSDGLLGVALHLVPRPDDLWVALFRIEADLTFTTAGLKPAPDLRSPNISFSLTSETELPEYLDALSAAIRETNNRYRVEVVELDKQRDSAAATIGAWISRQA